MQRDRFGINDNQRSLLYCPLGNYDVELRFRTIYNRTLFKKELEYTLGRENLSYNYSVKLIDSFGELQEKNPRLFYYKKKNLPIPEKFSEKSIHQLAPLYCYILYICLDLEEENYNIKEVLDEVNNIIKFTVIRCSRRKIVGQKNIKIIWNFREQLPKVTWKSGKE